MTTVAICIPTYRRLEYLGRLLASLAMIRLDEMVVHVVVVDNDADRSAETVVAAFSTQLPDLVYDAEPERGIAAARNRLVAHAVRLGVEYLAFLDDDEWVEPDWLINFVSTALVHGADAVAGPVIPDYEPDVPPWIVEGRFFNERPSRPTGEEVRVLGMGNTLIKRAWLDRLDGPFDRRLALTGGEDPDLWMKLFLLGLRMVWCEEATVHERISTSRATAPWLLKRQFNYGITGSRIVRTLNPSPSKYADRIARSVGHVSLGFILLGPSLVRGPAAIVHSLGHCARGLGAVVGLAGFASHPYRHIHGR